MFENIQGIYRHLEYDDKCNTQAVFLLLYIDNILIATNNPSLAAEVKNCLREKYIIKDLGLVDQFLGIQINQYKNPKFFTLSQRRYIEAMLYHLYMENCNDSYTPAVDSNSLDKYYKDPKAVPYVDKVPIEDICYFQKAI